MLFVMWIKVCGLTRPQDAECCSACGVDAVGINLYTGPRRVDLKQAAEILRALPAGIVPVALVQVRKGRIDAPVLRFALDHRVRRLQLYGDVSPEQLQNLLDDSFEPIVIRPVSDANFATADSSSWSSADAVRPWAVLLDTHDPDAAGGTGRPFPWEWIANARKGDRLDNWPPLILAGGLTPENVARAVTIARPYGVDVSSGVESAPGRKDPERIRAFVEAARGAES